MYSLGGSRITVACRLFVAENQEARVLHQQSLHHLHTPVLVACPLRWLVDVVNRHIVSHTSGHKTGDMLSPWGDPSVVSNQADQDGFTRTVMLVPAKRIWARWCLMRTHAMHICYLSMSRSTVCPFHLTWMPDWRGAEVCQRCSYRYCWNGTLHAHRCYTQDPLVAKLSGQQRALRRHIEATGDSRDRTKWHRERCHLLETD